MTIRNEQRLKEELVVFLRNSDTLSTTERGVTTTSETFSGTGAPQTLTLTNNVVRNIRSVTVTGTPYTVYTQYTPSYGTTTTTISGTFTSGTNNITVSYDYSSGTNERIFPDYPEIVYLADSCPRIGFDIEMSKTEMIGIGAPNYLTDSVATIKIYSKNRKSIDGYIYTLRNAIKTYQKSFYTFPIVYPSTVSPPMTIDYLNKKVFMSSIDLMMKLNFES